MFGHELKHLPVLLLEGPVPQLFNIPVFDLIHCQELLIVLFMRLEEAGLADQPAGLLALGVDAYVEDVVAFVTFQQALGGH